MPAIIWHNPRCSKSRQTLALLEEHGYGVDQQAPDRALQVRRYLDDPPTADRLAWVLERLAMSPRDLMRRREAVYRELGLADESLSDPALIGAMVENPRLIERPVVIIGDRVALGRPPENVLSLVASGE